MTSSKYSFEQRVAAFWEKVDRSGGEDACWPWLGARVPAGGYGRFLCDKLIASHRVAFLLANGFLPADKDIMHLCDNPPCCNPRHLKSATTAENMRDAWVKGRNFRKLTDKQVREIRQELKNWRRGMNKQLADRYGVSASLICDIRFGKRRATVSTQ